MLKSVTTTRGVEVKVQSRYVPERSAPDRGGWLFAYTVRITNHGAETVQLVSRHWIIRDATGKEEEVRGPGVVGDQPVLRVGESYEYTSACPLRTRSGTMHGTYQMVVRGSGEAFNANIAPFTLSTLEALN